MQTTPVAILHAHLLIRSNHSFCEDVAITISSQVTYTIYFTLSQETICYLE